VGAAQSVASVTTMRPLLMQRPAAPTTPANSRAHVCHDFHFPYLTSPFEPFQAPCPISHAPPLSMAMIS